MSSSVSAQLKPLLPFMDGLKGRYLLGAMLLLVTNGFALAIPWMMKLAIEAIKAPEGAGYPASNAAIAIALLAIVHCFVRIFSRTAILHAARVVEFRVREALFEKLLSLDISFYGGERTGDILSRLSNDLTNVRMLAGFGVMSIMNTFIIYLSAAGLMLMISPSLTLAAVAPLPVMVLIVQAISGRIFSVSQQAQEELSRLSSRTEEAVSAVRAIKGYCREPTFEKLFREASGAFLSKNLQLAALRGMVIPVMASVTGLGTLAVLYIGGRQVISGSITLGDFVAFSGYLALLVWPTVVLGWVITLVHKGAASMSRINQLMSTEPALSEDEAPETADGLKVALELRNLTFSYNGRKVLESLNLTIKAGERIGISGPLGCGKSTLLKIMARLLPLDDGMLFLDGADANRLSIGSIRSIVGYVPQEAFLFSRSISENISYGGTADPARGAAMAGLSDDIAGFSQGMETMIGERGVMLSGGQRQRVALARALVRMPDLLLLDDPLASVDAGREEEILNALEENWKGKTVIIVSHRPSAFRDCHRVVSLEAGRIVAVEKIADSVL